MYLEPIIHSEVSQKEKDKHRILMHTYGTQKDGADDPMYGAAKETQTQRTDFWTQWEKERMGWFERIALKHTHYHMSMQV